MSASAPQQDLWVSFSVRNREEPLDLPETSAPSARNALLPSRRGGTDWNIDETLREQPMRNLAELENP
jgi:hypothetical protein